MSHVATITIDYTKVSADLTDFPIYIDLSDMPASFWSVVADGGGDIRIFKDDDSTELPRDVLSCDTSAETGELYVKFTGTLSSSSATKIHIYADGTSSDYATDATYGRNNVWTGYDLVLHLREDIVDSTGLNTPYMNSGSLSFDSDGAIYDTNSEYIVIPYNTRFNYTSTMTYQSWGDTAQANRDSWLSKGEPWTSGKGYWLLIENALYFTASRPGVAYSNVYPVPSDPDVNQTNFLVYKKDGANGMYVYKDGSQLGHITTNATNDYTTNTNNVYIGQRYVNGSAEAWYGHLKEVRLTDTAFSEEWIETDNANQSSPSTFYTAEAPTASDLSIDIYDALSISEDLTTEREDSISINIYDSITVVDYLPPYYEDQIFISEAVTIEIGVISDLLINVNDEVGIVSEYITSTVSGGASVSEEVITIEDIAVELNTLGGIDISDSVSLDENIQTEINSIISVYDEISIIENIEISISAVEDRTIEVNDNIATDEVIAFGSAISISTNDDVSLTEDVAVELNILGGIDISESIIVSEDYQISVGSVPDLAVDVIDNVSLEESSSVISSIAISSFDEISNSELIDVKNLLLQTFLFDSVSLTESIVSSSSGGISIVDEIVIEEDVINSNQTLGGINLFDSILIAESLDLEKVLFIETAEEITISENIAIVNSQLGNISITDNLSIEEIIATANNLSTSIIDSVLIQEETEIALNLGDIQINDSLLIDEEVVNENNYFIAIVSAVTIIETVSFYLTHPAIELEINDSITVSEELIADGPFVNPYKKKPENYQEKSDIYKKKPNFINNKRIYKKKKIVYNN